MIARIAASMVFTLRLLTRSRALGVLAVSVLAMVLLLPAVLSGDGTPEGDMRIMILYPVAAILTLLVPATLLGACALPASEIASGRFQLTRIRPARTWEIWTGQWLGLALLNALLLFVAFAAITVLTLPHASHSKDFARPGLHPAAIIHPILPNPRDTALDMAKKMRERGAIPEGQSEEEIVSALALRIETAYLPLAPGESLEADFQLHRPLIEGETLAVSLALRSPMGLLSDLDGELVLRNPDTAATICQPIHEIAGGKLQYSFEIEKALAGADRLSLAFSLAESSADSSVLYNPRRGLTLRIARGSAWGNVLKAGLITLSLLLLMAALGLTLGVMFSFPVAAFLAAALLLSGGAARYAVSEGVESGAGTTSPAVFARLADGVVATVSTISKPVSGYRPGTLLAERTWIEPETVARAICWRGIFYPALLGFLACAALNRREAAS